MDIEALVGRGDLIEVVMLNTPNYSSSVSACMFQTQQKTAYAEGQQSPPPLRRPHHLAKPKMLRANDYLYREPPGIANH